jgi:hypothetical protein
VIIRLSAAAPSPKFVFASGSLQHHLYPWSFRGTVFSAFHIALHRNWVFRHRNSHSPILLHLDLHLPQLPPFHRLHWTLPKSLLVLHLQHIRPNRHIPILPLPFHAVSLTYNDIIHGSLNLSKNTWNFFMPMLSGSIFSTVICIIKYHLREWLMPQSIACSVLQQGNSSSGPRETSLRFIEIVALIWN